jgi:predicted GH43/DUF377 family glycosyl hydrolase
MAQSSQQSREVIGLLANRPADKASPPFQLERRGVVMRPDPANPYERGGVLNPAAVMQDGVTYLFYRAVAEHPPNYSRILMATCRLLVDDRIETVRLGRIALEPQAEYELQQDGEGGGVEDPRITPLDNTYYMAYTAYGTLDGRLAPRIALARSRTLFDWERIGLVSFSPLHVDAGGETVSFDLAQMPNKDAILFPERVGGRYYMLHRPMFPRSTGLPESIWLSWSRDLLYWEDHHLVLSPTLPWESLKVGGGTPPLRTPQGWLTFYHGVEGLADNDPNRRYHAGALLLDLDDPARVLYQSPQPVLSPQQPDETVGVVSNVVFPTGVVAQPDGRVDVYYGMADQAIGLATTRLP